jgi:glycosyltransferase involved in cell wall biosynthesis
LKLVFDFCDAIHLRSPIETRLLTRTADAVIVSCEDLAVYARRHNPKVYVIPNSLPRSQIADAPAAQANQLPVVGWVGNGKVHRDNLELLLEPFAEVAGRTPFVFRIIGSRRIDAIVHRFRAIRGMHVDAIEWLEPRAAREAVRAFDVAVLPLKDIEWNRKLATKLVEYLSAGVPLVASPVGDNRFLLVDQQSGMFAATADDWARGLSALFGAPDLRRELASNGLKVVQERCRLDINAQKLAAILRQLVAHRCSDQ